ncbi:flagelliform spidroin-like protein, partial [Nephila pilipes]
GGSGPGGPGGSGPYGPGGSGPGSRISSLVNAIMRSMNGSGFNYQMFGNILSQYLSGTGLCNPNDINVLLDALLAALHCANNQGSSSIPSSPTPSAMNAYSISVRRMFEF